MQYSVTVALKTNIKSESVGFGLGLQSAQYHYSCITLMKLKSQFQPRWEVALLTKDLEAEKEIILATLYKQSVVVLRMLRKHVGVEIDINAGHVAGYFNLQLFYPKYISVCLE